MPSSIAAPSRSGTAASSFGRGLGQRAQRALRALQGGLQLGPARPRLAGLGQARARPLQCFALHGR